MQPTRMLAMRATQMRAIRPTQFRAIRPTQFLGMSPSLALRKPMPKEEHSAHTISQRLRTIKKMPVELVPLAIVIGAALLAAVWSLFYTFFRDRTLRLTRTGPATPSKRGDH